MFLQFFDTVFGGLMVNHLQKMKFSSFFLLACGAVVKEGEALTGLQLAAEKYVCSADMFFF